MHVSTATLGTHEYIIHSEYIYEGKAECVYVVQAVLSNNVKLSPGI